QLFVPSSLADQRASATQALVAAEFLVSERRCLSFRHQSFYEFILARRFAREESAFIDHVLSRQDGLFVRPTVLATLMYMRDTAPARYTRVVETLLTRDDIRLHIRSLVVDYVASQREPGAVEIHLVLPLLGDRVFGPRILLAAAGSPRWFELFRD